RKRIPPSYCQRRYVDPSGSSHGASLSRSSAVILTLKFIPASICNDSPSGRQNINRTGRVPGDAARTACTRLNSSALAAGEKRKTSGASLSERPLPFDSLGECL